MHFLQVDTKMLDGSWNMLIQDVDRIVIRPNYGSDLVHSDKFATRLPSFKGRQTTPS